MRKSINVPMNWHKIEHTSALSVVLEHHIVTENSEVIFYEASLQKVLI